jgi:hypothetical protein
MPWRFFAALRMTERGVLAMDVAAGQHTDAEMVGGRLRQP